MLLGAAKSDEEGACNFAGPEDLAKEERRWADAYPAWPLSVTSSSHNRDCAGLTWSSTSRPRRKLREHSRPITGHERDDPLS